MKIKQKSKINRSSILYIFDKMLNYKSSQKMIISGYRILMMIVILVISIAVLAYIFLMVFYAINGNWGIPIILSPTQEKVLVFQGQASTLEAALLKNKVDLATATQKYALLNKEINNMESLLAKFDTATHYESNALSKTDVDIRNVLQEKNINALDMEKAARNVKPLLKSIDQELAAGVITKDEAIARRMSIESMLNAATDSRISQITLEEQGRLASTASRTLGDQSATSLVALQSLNSEAQLTLLDAQATVDAETAKQSVEQLKVTVADGERVLGIAKQSPYYKALNKPVFTAFVPYDNLDHATPGTPVYDCLLQVILCWKVGTVTQIYDAEEYAKHPLFKSDIKGKLVDINFTSKKSAESPILFFGYKPLLF